MTRLYVTAHAYIFQLFKALDELDAICEDLGVQ